MERYVANVYIDWKKLIAFIITRILIVDNVSLFKKKKL